MTASQAKPPQPLVITPKAIPPDVKLSAKDAAQPPKIYSIQNPENLPKALPPGVKASAKDAARPLRSFPVQNPANLPKSVPPNAVPVMTVPPLPAEKPEFNGTPNAPDPHVYLQGGDNFGTATVIPSIPYSDTGHTTGYFNDYEGNCGGTGAPDVVYRFDSPTNMAVTISLCGGVTNYDTKLYVCVNGDPNNILACNDDYCGLQSQLDNLSFTVSNSYYIVVDGYASYYGNYSLNVTGVVLPPDPCSYGGNVIYSNGPPDGLNGLSAYRTADGAFDRWVIDDMVFSNQVIITDFHWVCVTDDGFDWTQTDEIMILNDNGGVPGQILYDIRNVSNTRTPTGRILWNRPEYVYTIRGLNITLPPGRYWVGLRPVSATSPNNFWETAPVQGSPVYVSYPDLGYPMWTPSNQVFGADYDVSFCVTGEIAPPPNPCNGADVLYNNGAPDYYTGWNDFRTSDGANNFFIIDDMVFSNPVIIHDLHWYTVELGLDWNGTDDYIIVADNDGVPGATLYEVWDVPNTRVATCNMPFGLPEYIYSINGLNISLPAGRYWIGLRPVGFQTGIGMSYWSTTAVQNSPVFVDYTQYRFPPWTPGVIVFGADYDVAFCVTGVPWQEPTGSCCDSTTGYCVDGVPQSQCPFGFRFTPNVLCADLIPPCRMPEPTGSCCDSTTGNCIDGVPRSQCPTEFRFTPNVLCADLVPPCRRLPGCNYIPGDINGNGSTNGVDIVYAVNYLKGAAAPPIDCYPCCPNTPNPFYAAGDVNGNCAFNGIDITFYVRYLKGQVPSLLYCPDCPPQPGCPPPELK